MPEVLLQLLLGRSVAAARSLETIASQASSASLLAASMK